MLFFKYNFEGEKKKNQQIRIHSFPTANNKFNILHVHV